MKFQNIIILLFTLFSSAAHAGLSCASFFLHQKHWEKEIQNLYKTGADSWITVHQSNLYNGSPTNKAAYALEERLEAKEHHAETLVKLGYKRKQDVNGNWGLVPPSTYLEIVKNYSIILSQHIADKKIKKEDILELGLVFIKKGHTNVSDKMEDYVVVKIGEEYPPPNEYILVDFLNNSQLPNNIFFEIISRGIFMFPLDRFIIHEMAHITEIIDNPIIMREMRLNAKLEHTRLSYNAVENKQYNERRFVITESFALPDLSKREQIQEAINSLPLHSARTAQEAISILSQNYRGEKLDLVATQVTEAFKALIYRMGGGMRDTYYIDRISGTSIDYSGLINEVNYKRDSKGESLLGYIYNIRGWLGRIKGRNLADSYFMATHNWKNWESHNYKNFEGSEAEFLRVSEDAIIRDIASLYIAFRTGLELEIKPEDIWIDGLQNQTVNPESKTGIYLRSYLPPHSFTRQVFGL